MSFVRLRSLSLSSDVDVVVTDVPAAKHHSDPPDVGIHPIDLPRQQCRDPRGGGGLDHQFHSVVAEPHAIPDRVIVDAEDRRLY